LLCIFKRRNYCYK